MTRRAGGARQTREKMKRIEINQLAASARNQRERRNEIEQKIISETGRPAAWQQHSQRKYRENRKRSNETDEIAKKACREKRSLAKLRNQRQKTNGCLWRLPRRIGLMRRRAAKRLL